MGSDREDFTSSAEGLPIYEGRMVQAFDYRAKAWISGRGRAAVWRELPFNSPDKAISPQWRLAQDLIPQKLGDRWGRYRIGFCDIASPTNQRAFVAALIPPNVICGHSVPTIEIDDADPELTLLLLSVINAFAIDFVAKPKVSLHMSFTVVDSLPLPRAYSGTYTEREIARRALQLTATGPEMATFWRESAQRVGFHPLTDKPEEDPEKRRRLRAEVDVLVARDLYGLTRDEMRYVMDPSDILGPDCAFETFGALKRADEREFNDRYLTRDMILEAWDELAVVEIAASQPDEHDPSILPDGAWAIPIGTVPVDSVQLQLAGVLNTLSGATLESDVRMVALYVMEPRLLTSQVTGERQRQWLRLVGSAADPLPGSVSAVAPRVSTIWGQSVGQLRAAGALIHTEADMTWSPGPGLSRYVIPAWAAGRARFILSMLAELKTNNVVAALPSEDQDWIAGRAAA